MTKTKTTKKTTIVPTDIQIATKQTGLVVLSNEECMYCLNNRNCFVPRNEVYDDDIAICPQCVKGLNKLI